jgi:BirA family biotin operon repressor/biotin-[acetyl-CoA-carboxylase] ligase
MELPDTAVAAGFTLLHVDEADSTNEAALRAAELGANRFWVVADLQRAGRGRHGRGWVSPKGNLHASLALRDICPPAKAPLLGFVAGVSLAEAVLSLAPALKPDLHLKWPNDCLVEGAKLSGILIEASSLAGGASALAIGIGVNVLAAPDGLDQKASALAHHAPDISAGALFAALSARMAANLAHFDRGEGFAAIRANWLAHALPIGAPIRVRLPDGERRGGFAGLGEGGELLLESEAGIETIIAGDVLGGDPSRRHATAKTARTSA